MTNLNELKKPFPENEIKWRAGATNQQKTKALALAYIDARNVMDRLDEVCGPNNWQDDYKIHNSGTTTCGIGIKIADEWVWKWDGAGQTDYEGEKGGISDAFKRAAVKWGIGRYLYQLDGVWVACEQKGKSVVLKQTPKLPAWAVPGDEVKKSPKSKNNGNRKPPAQEVEELGYDEKTELVRPLPAEQVKEGIEKKAGGSYKNKTATAAFRGFIAGSLGALYQTDIERHAVTKYLTGKASIKEVPGPYVYAIKDWLGMDDDKEPSEFAKQEAPKLLAAALKEQGQQEMEIA